MTRILWKTDMHAWRLLPTVLLAVAVATATPKLDPIPATVTGTPPVITVSGLKPGQVARIHMGRSFKRWAEKDGKWQEELVKLHAWADYRAGKNGIVDVRRASPLRGTYRRLDAYGLLWSGRSPGDPLLAQSGASGLEPSVDRQVAANVWAFANGGIVGNATVRFIDPPDLRVAQVADQGLNGVYAAPASMGRRPIVLLLHGSEGGNAADARALAVRFAGQGFAAFALNYFAWDLAKLEGVPRAHVNLPIEVLERARAWVARQPEANADLVGVYGHSKGAEFAALAAVRYPWIKAVVACVPTDVVWEGYGSDDERNLPEHRRPMPAVASSWSYGGRPLPYIPLRPFNWREPNRYFDNTERYELSRKDHPGTASAAAIPIERSAARFLLLGGGKDEVWASGQMTRALEARMQKAGRGRHVVAKVYPNAGHQICGDGTYPPRVWGKDSTDPRRKNLDAEGAAAADAWKQMTTFLKRELSVRR